MTTILILEDNPVVLQILGLVLKGRGGYRVLEAATEGEAVSHMERHASEIELLIADVCVEERPGRAVADRLAKLSPRLRLLFISGYPKEHLVESGWLEAGDSFLAKPFPPERLLRSVQDILTGSCPADAPRPGDIHTACAGNAP